jgi:hypothetical protein
MLNSQIQFLDNKIHIKINMKLYFQKEIKYFFFIFLIKLLMEKYNLVIYFIIFLFKINSTFYHLLYLINS